MVLESLSRGIPVLAANTGGLREAMLGVDFVLPVNPVTHYRAAVDEHMVPVAEVPPQDVNPWERALRRLTTDRVHWEDLSTRSRAAALEYWSSLSARPFSDYLERLTSQPKPAAIGKSAGLSFDKRRLLELKLSKRQSGSTWFPLAAPPGDRPVLYIFPHAGSGVAPYLNWPPELRPCPVRYPGRETRRDETPIEEMRSMVEALGREIASRLTGRFLFFGHSMGAGIAFELTRWLRRNGHALPRMLIVSSAKAPRLRPAGSAIDPTDSELLDRVAAISGQSREVLATALTPLRADTKLYRHWRPDVEDPLDLPLVALGGDRDPSLDAAALTGWRDETSSRFERHLLPGGHFYLQDARQRFFDLLVALTAGDFENR
jgi:medium-chain acyl-[acyl-carrier-protein] hydrolase